MKTLAFVPQRNSLPVCTITPYFTLPSSAHATLQTHDWLHGFPRLSTDTSEHIRFLVFSFSLFHFLAWLRAVD